MAETPSTMLPLGTKAPPFKLKNVINDEEFVFNEANPKTATVIMFICNHCPYVKHIQKKLVEIVKRYEQQDVTFIAINSNDAKKYPADSPEQMKLEALQNHYSFPYLYDETQEVAKAYQAACTPDFFVFDDKLRCVYRGRFDKATPGNRHDVTGEDLCGALDALLAEEAIAEEQFPSVGCNIKWK